MLSFWQYCALVLKILSQKRHAPIMATLEVVTPIIFICVFVLIWAISGGYSKERIGRDYYRQSDLQSVRTLSVFPAITCNNETYSTSPLAAVQNGGYIPNVPGFSPCTDVSWQWQAVYILMAFPMLNHPANTLALTASFGNPPPPSPIPRGTYPLTISYGWRQLFNLYLSEFESYKVIDPSTGLPSTHRESGDSGTLYGGEKGAQPFMIPTLDDHILFKLLGAVGHIDTDLTTVQTILSGPAVRGKLFFSPDTPAVRAFVDHLNTTTNLFQFVFGGYYGSKEQAMEASTASENAKQSWAVIDIPTMNADALSFGIYINRTTIPDTKTTFLDDYFGGYPDLGKAELYVTSGYLTLQRSVYDYYVSEVLQAAGSAATLRPDPTGVNGGSTAPSTASTEFVFVPMGHPTYDDLSFLADIGTYTPLLIALSFLFPVSQMTRVLVGEKETRLRETLDIMGLGAWPYHVSWATISILQYAVTAALSMLVLHFTFLPKSDMGLLFLILFTFGISASAFSGFISSLFYSSRPATFVAPLIFLICATPYFALSVDGISAGVQWVCCLLSPSAIALAFIRILKFEFTTGLQGEQFVMGSIFAAGLSSDSSDFPAATDDLRTRPHTSQRDATVALVYVWLMMILDAVLYWLLMTYFNAIMPASAAEKARHPLFFIIDPLVYVGDKLDCFYKGGDSVDEIYGPDSGGVYDGRDPAGCYEDDDGEDAASGDSVSAFPSPAAIGGAPDDEGVGAIVRADNPPSTAAAAAFVEVRGLVMKFKKREVEEAEDDDDADDDADEAFPNASDADENGVRGSDETCSSSSSGSVSSSRRPFDSISSVSSQHGLTNHPDNNNTNATKGRRNRKKSKRNCISRFFSSIAAKLSSFFDLSPPVYFNAVDGLCLDFELGEVNVLLGHNGAGKTTAINLMVGMLRPTRGDCRIDGKSIVTQKAAARTTIGFCPQHNVLFHDSLTCREHLLLFARLKGFRGEALDRRVDDLLRAVNLHEKRHFYPSQLSGGQKRRLSIANAFVGDAKLIFLDEPTAGVDVTSRHAIWRFIKHQAEVERRSIVLTTHFMEEADILGDRIGIMARGRLKCRGSPLFLKSRLGVGYTLSISMGKGLLQQQQQHHYDSSTSGPYSDNHHANSAQQQHSASVSHYQNLSTSVVPPLPSVTTAGGSAGGMRTLLPSLQQMLQAGNQSISNPAEATSSGATVGAAAPSAENSNANNPLYAVSRGSAANMITSHSHGSALMLPPAGSAASSVLASIAHFIPTAEVASYVQGELVVRLPLDHASTFPTMLKVLEAHSGTAAANGSTSHHQHRYLPHQQHLASTTTSSGGQYYHNNNMHQQPTPIATAASSSPFGEVSASNNNHNHFVGSGGGCGGDSHAALSTSLLPSPSLSQQQHQPMIRGISIALTTLEDVFMRITNEEEEAYRTAAAAEATAKKKKSAAKRGGGGDHHQNSNSNSSTVAASMATLGSGGGACGATIATVPHLHEREHHHQTVSADYSPDRQQQQQRPTTTTTTAEEGGDSTSADLAATNNNTNYQYTYNSNENNSSGGTANTAAPSPQRQHDAGALRTLFPMDGSVSDDHQHHHQLTRRTRAANARPPTAGINSAADDSAHHSVSRQRAEIHHHGGPMMMSPPRQEGEGEEHHSTQSAVGAGGSGGNASIVVVPPIAQQQEDGGAASLLVAAPHLVEGSDEQTMHMLWHAEKTGCGRNGKRRGGGGGQQQHAPPDGSSFASATPATTEEGAYSTSSNDDDEAAARLRKKSQQQSRTRQQFKALLMKRWLNIKRDKKTLTLQIIFPVVCVLASMLLRLLAFPSTKVLEVTDEHSLYNTQSQFVYDKSCQSVLNNDNFGSGPDGRPKKLSPSLFFNGAANAEAVSERLISEFFRGGESNTLPEDASNFVPPLTLDTAPAPPRFQAVVCNDPAMRSTLNSFGTPAGVAALGSTVVTIFGNYTSPHQPAIALSNYYTRMIHRYSPSTSTVTNPDGLEYIDVTQNLGALPATAFEKKYNDARNMGLAAIIIILPFVFVPSTFIAWIVKEKQSKSRHLQTLAGLGFWNYWLSNFIFDIVCILISSALVIIIFFIFNSQEYIGMWEPFVATILVFVLFGVSSIAISYAGSFLFSDSSVAQNVALLVNFIFGFLLVLAVFIMKLIEETKVYADYVRWAFRLSPAYCLGESISTLATTELLNGVSGDADQVRPMSLDVCGYPLIYMGAESVLFLLVLIYIDHPAMRLRRRRARHREEVSELMAMAGLDRHNRRSSTGGAGGGGSDDDDDDEEEGNTRQWKRNAKREKKRLKKLAKKQLKLEMRMRMAGVTPATTAATTPADPTVSGAASPCGIGPSVSELMTYSSASPLHPHPCPTAATATTTPATTPATTPTTMLGGGDASASNASLSTATSCSTRPLIANRNTTADGSANLYNTADNSTSLPAPPPLTPPSTIVVAALTVPTAAGSPSSLLLDDVSSDDDSDDDDSDEEIRNILFGGKGEDSDVEEERNEIMNPFGGAGNVPRNGATDAAIVRGLRKTFPNGTRAVKNMTFGVKRGEILALLGANGAGKSTTIAMICQDLDPTNGTVEVDGVDILTRKRTALVPGEEEEEEGEGEDDARLNPVSKIGYCPQFDALLDTLTPTEHLTLFCGIRGIAEHAIKGLVARLMRTVGLAPYRNTIISQLSGGNKRKLSVAMAVLGAPKILILDEPSAGMDPVAKRTLWRVIELATSYCSVLLTTHHLEEVEALADRVGIMKAGRLKCIGDKTALKAKYGRGIEVQIRLNVRDTHQHSHHNTCSNNAPTGGDPFAVEMHPVVGAVTNRNPMLAAQDKGSTAPFDGTSPQQQEEGDTDGGGRRKRWASGKWPSRPAPPPPPPSFSAHTHDGNASPYCYASADDAHAALQALITARFPTAVYKRLPFSAASVMFPQNNHSNANNAEGARRKERRRQRRNKRSKNDPNQSISISGALGIGLIPPNGGGAAAAAEAGGGGGGEDAEDLTALNTLSEIFSFMESCKSGGPTATCTSAAASSSSSPFGTTVTLSSASAAHPQPVKEYAVAQTSIEGIFLAINRSHKKKKKMGDSTHGQDEDEDE